MADELKGELCPICGTKNLLLAEEEMDIPYFGMTYIFAMNCSNCKFHKADVEAAEQKAPCKYTLNIDSEKDMHVRVIKSSLATVKVPYIGSIEPGPASNGYITNIEGVLNRIKEQVESMKDDENKEVVDKARKLAKKINRIIWGSEKAKLIIEDPGGNSAIISDKAVVEKLKVK